MRAYTSLEQSKKLAEILPLESADMNYSNMCPKGVMYSNHYSAGLSSYNDASRMNQENIDFYLQGEDYKGIIAWEILPCWSLAALFSMLPKSAYLEKGSSTELCRLTLPVELISSDWNLEPIDTCVDMVIKLHELNLL